MPAEIGGCLYGMLDELSDLTTLDKEFYFYVGKLAWESFVSYL